MATSFECATLARTTFAFMNGERIGDLSGKPGADRRRRLISIKADAEARADKAGLNRSSAVPQSAIPVVIAVVALFAVFMGVIGTVSIWSNLPDRKTRD